MIAPLAPEIEQEAVVEEDEIFFSSSAADGESLTTIFVYD